jgi:hypothetical protein
MTTSIFDLIKSDWKPWFRRFKLLRGKEQQTWSAWFSFLRILFGLKLTAGDLELFRQCTGRGDAPSGGFNEAWLICGRRSGKSLMLAMIAIYVAVFRDWSQYLQPGERGTVMVLSADRRSARTIFRYATAFLKALDVVSIERETNDTIELSNGISIEIATASYKTVRGYTIVAALLDEAAFWSDEGSNPDAEILAALRPSMATIPGALLLVASSPYAKRGIIYDAFQKHFGCDGDNVLVWKAPTRLMNPSVPQSFIDGEYAKDRASAAAEYGAEFRDDISGWADRSLIEAAVTRGVTVRPPLPGINYRAFADPSGGQKDSFTAAVSHAEGQMIILDCLIEIRAPFNPDEAVGRIADVLESYHVSTVTADRYAAQWPISAFARHNITLRHSDRDRSAIYLDCLPLIATGRVRLLDNEKLITQFTGLQRTTMPSGRDKVDHGKTGADDCCNACAGALVMCANKPTWTVAEMYPHYDGPSLDEKIEMERGNIPYSVFRRYAATDPVALEAYLTSHPEHRQ